MGVQDDVWALCPQKEYDLLASTNFQWLSMICHSPRIKTILSNVRLQQQWKNGLQQWTHWSSGWKTQAPTVYWSKPWFNTYMLGTHRPILLTLQSHPYAVNNKGLGGIKFWMGGCQKNGANTRSTIGKCKNPMIKQKMDHGVDQEIMECCLGHVGPLKWCPAFCSRQK